MTALTFRLTVLRSNLSPFEDDKLPIHCSISWVVIFRIFFSRRNRENFLTSEKYFSVVSVAYLLLCKCAKYAENVCITLASPVGFTGSILCWPPAAGNVFRLNIGS